MDETVKQGNATETQDNAEKTFTQSELNQILKERLDREKAKYDGFDELKAKAAKFDELEEASKSELQKATEKATALEAEILSLKKEKEVRAIREKVAAETGVPIGLLTMETEDECKEQAKALLEWSKPGSYPTVKDGGEVTKVASGSTSQQFEDWFKTAFS